MPTTSRAVVVLALAVAAFPAAAGPLTGPIATLEPLLGVWEVDAEWAGGPRLWARAVYSPGVGGRTIEGRVFVKEGDGAPYLRYLTIFSYDAQRRTFTAHTVDRDGKVSPADLRRDGSALVTEWTEGSTRIRDRTEVLDDGRMRWTVQVRPAGADAYRTVMDATWSKRLGGARPAPIDPTRFAATLDPRPFTVETTIAAPVDDVYRAWTDPDAFRAAYDPARGALRAEIDLAIGGRYEWLFDGITGSNGCQVLSFVPQRHLAFTWNAPPEQPDTRAQRTWVSVDFEPAGEGATRVRLTHLGFGRGAAWDETRAYFQKAWPHVLQRFRENLESARARPRAVAPAD